MRKIISLGLLALSLFIFSSQVFASNAAACDEANLSKDLHGLCVAWHNANDKNKEKFAKKYRERSGGDEVPGSEECPCWTPDELATAVAEKSGLFCEAKVDLDSVIYEELPQLFAGALLPEDPGTYCVINTGIFILSPTTPGENVVCRGDIQTLQDTVDEFVDEETGEIIEIPVFPECVI